MHVPLWVWIAFNAFVIFMLAMDLFVLHKKERPVSIRESLSWTAVVTASALIFNVILYYWQGKQIALEFLTGYLIEYSLSMDNLFVFIMIFSYFHVPRKLQHPVLFYGILGALVMRGLFIAAGVTLVERLHWIIYVLGAFLVFTGIKMALHSGVEIHPSRNPVLKLLRKLIPISHDYEGQKFFLRRDGKLWATPLFVVLVVIETTDVMFAVDSVPAILAITREAFIVYTSNVFAILGLRALFFALAGVMQMFYLLHYGLSAILVFVGVKMLIEHWYQIPIVAALGTVVGLLVVSVGASMLFPPKKKEIPDLPEGDIQPPPPLNGGEEEA